MSAPASPRPVALPAGVADPAGSSGFVAALDGGVDALELATGRVLWRSHDAFLPVLATNDALAAAGREGTAVRMLLLDAATGARRWAGAPLSPSAPLWTVTGARLEGGSLVLAWWAQDAPRGTPPDPSSPRYGELGRGAARVELATGRVEPLPAPEEPAYPGDPLPGAPAGDLLPDVGGTVRRWAADGVVAGLALEGGGGDAKRLVLRRWSPETGAALPDAVLLDPAPPLAELRHHRFPDAGHVFLQRCPPGGECRWLVFSAATGERVADLAFGPGAEEEMAVVGGVLFHLAPGGPAADPGLRPRVLRAVDPDGGAVLWEHPVAPARDTPMDLA